MTPRILVLEGADATGTTTHADRLAAALRAEGHNARAFHHAKPADADPILAALDYARQRRVLCLHAEPGEVIVADRWWHSSSVLGTALRYDRGERPLLFIRDLADDEAHWGPRVDAALLTAPADVLDARLAARGTPTTALDRALRWGYPRHVGRADRSGWDLTLDTSRPADDVAAALLAWARGVLR